MFLLYGRSFFLKEKRINSDTQNCSATQESSSRKLPSQDDVGGRFSFLFTSRREFKPLVTAAGCAAHEHKQQGVMMF